MGTVYVCGRCDDPGAWESPLVQVVVIDGCASCLPDEPRGDGA